MVIDTYYTRGISVAASPTTPTVHAGIKTTTLNLTDMEDKQLPSECKHYHEEIAACELCGYHMPICANESCPDYEPIKNKEQ